MKISRIEAEVHLYEDVPNWREPLRLAVSFGDGRRLRLRIGGDGATLVVDREALEATLDLGRYGRTATFDVTDRLDPRLRGATTEPPLQITSRAGRLVGAAFRLVGEPSFNIWVDGDEFHWGSEEALLAHEWPPGEEARVEAARLLPDAG